jgi:hypothetical protein
MPVKVRSFTASVVEPSFKSVGRKLTEMPVKDYKQVGLLAIDETDTVNEQSEVRDDDSDNDKMSIEDQMEMLRKSIVNRRSVVSRTSMVDDTPIMDANISVRLLESASPEPVDKGDDDEGPVVVEEDDFEECLE